MKQTHRTGTVTSAILCCIFLATIGSGALAYTVPDTGITTCRDLSGAAIPCPAEGEQFFGQDANYGYGVMSFTPEADGTVTDNHTLLVWVATDTDLTYTWDEAVEQVSALNASSYKGHSDWRLPTATELGGILDYSIAEPGPMVEGTAFPACRQGGYWSSDSYAADPTKAWGVDFSTAEDVIADKSSTFYIRVVRGGE